MEALHEVSMILVCGFEPFNQEPLNPTQKLIEELEKQKITSSKYNHLSSLILPVSTLRAPEIFRQRLQELQPTKVLMMGQAGGAAKIRLERVALNWQEPSYPDEDGFQAPAGKIDPQGNDVYFCQLDLPVLKAQLETLQIPVEISLSAGGFVCNRIYYEFFQQTRSRISGVFVHFPFLDEQLVRNPKATSLSWNLQLKAFWEILKFLERN